MALIGTREAQDFEAKREWPDLAGSARSRWEFAKDVAAMANGGGGLIVYGLATMNLPAEQADEIHSVTLVRQDAVNGKMALAILAEHVSPPLVGVRIDFIEAATDTPNGIVLVAVPRQNGKVILCKTMEGDDAMKGYLFGFAQRDRDGTINWSRAEVSRMIRSGTDTISARLEAIESMLSSMRASGASCPAPVAEGNAELNARLDEILRDD